MTWMNLVYLKVLESVYYCQVLAVYINSQLFIGSFIFHLYEQRGNIIAILGEIF